MKQACIFILLFVLFVTGTDAFAIEAREAEEIIKSILEDDTSGEKSPDSAAPGAKRAPDTEKTVPKKKNTAAPSVVSERKPAAVSGRDRRGTAKEEEKAPQISSEEQALFKTGIDFYNSGLYEHSLKKFQELAAKFPQGSFKDGSRSWMGRVYLKLYRYDEAIKEFSAVPKDSGEYPSAVFHLGESYLMKGDQISAIENFEKVYMQSPQNELADKALLSAGKLYLSQNKGAQALDSVVKLIKYYKDRDTIDDAYYLMAKIYEQDVRFKDVETARKIYRQFLKKGESDERFGKSPLRKRVLEDLARIEKIYFRMER